MKRILSGRSWWWRLRGRWRLFRCRCPRCNSRDLRTPSCHVCRGVDSEEFVGGVARWKRDSHPGYEVTSREIREVWWRRFISS